LAHADLGVILARQGKTDEAIKHYDLALQAQPEVAWVQNNLGAALAKQGKIDEAIRHYHLALQAQPDDALARKNLGVALARQALPAMERPKEYSVWLVPAGPSHDDLKRLITSLSEEYGTPDFEPHVTLVGLGVVPKATDEAIVEDVESLARTICPYGMHLHGVGITDDPFRSLFLKVDQTPEVMSAGRRGLDLYRRIKKQGPSSTAYFPHLSLLYGHLPPAAKKKISDDLKVRKRIDISFTVSKLQLWVTSAKIPDWPASWERNWHMVKEFPIGESESCQKP
jgi:2'-5' RNA ligase